MTKDSYNEDQVGFLQLVFSDDAHNESVTLASAMFESESELLETWNAIPGFSGNDADPWVAVDLYDNDGDLINTRRISQETCEMIAQEPLETLVFRGKARNLTMLTILKASHSSRKAY